MNKFFIYLFIISNLWMYSQETTTARFGYDNIDLETLLIDIEETFDISFSYLDNTVADKFVKVENSKYSLDNIITLIERSTSLLFQRISSNNYVLIQKKKKKNKIFLPKSFDNLVINSATEILNKVTIKSYIATGISKNEDNSFTIIPHKLSILPGLTEPDVLKTLQHLPGVKSPNETVTGLHVRGGTGDQNLTIWDGIKMYQNGHLFGMISGFNPNIKQKIYFYNKGTNPRFGDRISSVIDIKTDSEIPSKTELEVGINALNADVNLNVPLLQDKLNVQVSGRRSYTDLYQSPTYIKYSTKVFGESLSKIPKDQSKGEENEDIIDMSNKFYYQDYNVKVNYLPSSKSYLYYSSIYINSILNNDIDNANTEILTTDLLKITNSGHSMGWKQKWNTNLTHDFNLYYSNYRFNYQNNKLYDKKSFNFFSKRNQIVDVGLRYETNYRIDNQSSLTGGYQLTKNNVQHIFDARNDGLSVVLNQNDFTINTHSIYTSFNYNDKSRFNFLGGFRYNFFKNIQESSFEPRLLLNVYLTDHITASATGEYKSQTINQIKESVISDFGLENNIWALSDTDQIPIIKSKQFTSGLTYKKNRLTVDVDVYYKHTTGITSLAIGFLNNIDPNGFHKGERFTKGIDFYIKKDYKNYKAWGTYTYNTIQNKYDEINDDILFSSSNEIKHALNLSLSYQYKKFQLAGGWNWYSGKPYTLATEEYDERNIPYWKYDAINSENLSNYHRLDISSMYSFTLDKSYKIKAKTGLALYNIYNRDNIINIEYHSSKVPGGNVAKVERHSLRFTPNVFFRVYF